MKLEPVYEAVVSEMEFDPERPWPNEKENKAGASSDRGEAEKK